jgi:hypothetical protein
MQSATEVRNVGRQWLPSIQGRLGYFPSSSECSLNNGSRISGNQTLIHGLEYYDRSVNVGKEFFERLLGSRKLVKDRGEQYADGKQGIRRVIPPGRFSKGQFLALKSKALIPLWGHPVR